MNIRSKVAHITNNILTIKLIGNNLKTIKKIFVPLFNHQLTFELISDKIINTNPLNININQIQSDELTINIYTSDDSMKKVSIPIIKVSNDYMLDPFKAYQIGIGRALLLSGSRISSEGKENAKNIVTILELMEKNTIKNIDTDMSLINSSLLGVCARICAYIILNYEPSNKIINELLLVNPQNYFCAWNKDSKIIEAFKNNWEVKSGKVKLDDSVNIKFVEKILKLYCQYTSKKMRIQSKISVFHLSQIIKEEDWKHFENIVVDALTQKDEPIQWTSYEKNWTLDENNLSQLPPLIPIKEIYNTSNDISLWKRYALSIPMQIYFAMNQIYQLQSLDSQIDFDSFIQNENFIFNEHSLIFTLYKNKLDTIADIILNKKFNCIAEIEKKINKMTNENLSLVQEKIKQYFQNDEINFLNTITLMQNLRQLFKEHDFIGVVGNQNTGKSALNKDIFGMRNTGVGVHCNTKDIYCETFGNPKRGIKKLHCIDFPAANSCYTILKKLPKLLLPITTIVFLVTNHDQTNNSQIIFNKLIKRLHCPVVVLCNKTDVLIKQLQKDNNLFNNEDLSDQIWKRLTIIKNEIENNEPKLKNNVFFVVMQPDFDCSKLEFKPSPLETNKNSNLSDFNIVSAHNQLLGPFCIYALLIHYLKMSNKTEIIEQLDNYLTKTKIGKRRKKRWIKSFTI